MYLFDYHCLHTIMVLSLVIAWWLDLGDEQGPTRDVLPVWAGDAARAPVGRWGQEKGFNPAPTAGSQQGQSLQ